MAASSRAVGTFLGSGLGAGLASGVLVPAGVPASTGFFFSTGFLAAGVFVVGFWNFGITSPGSASGSIAGRLVRVSTRTSLDACGPSTNVLGDEEDFFQPEVLAPDDAVPAGNLTGQPP